jgi:hypothetical protein
VGCPPIIGGPPISYPVPPFSQAPPRGSYPVQGNGLATQPQPYPQPLSFPRNRSGGQAVSPGLPRPIIRAVPEDGPPFSRPVQTGTPQSPVTLPPPEQLGIGLAQATGSARLDWNQVHQELRRLGTLNFQMQRLPEGNYRLTLILPTAQPDRTLRVEAQGCSEGEAVRSAIAQVEQGLVGR